MDLSEVVQAGRDDKPCDVTVAICTYRRPEMLGGVLETLGDQEVEGAVTWEVLVIDNDPGRSARSVVDRFVLSSRLRLYYIQEQKLGLSHARNRAILECHGNIIAFLDDDVLVSRNWLVELLRTFERTGADCVGGRVLVKWEGTPDDAVEKCQAELVAFDKGGSDLRIVGRGVPIGANLAFKVDILRNQPMFISALGRSSRNLMGCEEIELLLRLAAQGRSIWYSARSVVMHRIGGERLRREYYVRREYWNGVSLAEMDRLQQSPPYCHFKAWARLAQSVLVLMPSRLWALFTHNGTTHFFDTCRQRKYFGYWAGTIGLARKPG
jgi:glycosyltransferase involved in cell wall biosynthesis